MNERRLFKSGGQWAVFEKGVGGWNKQLCDWTDDKAAALAVKNEGEEEAIPASGAVEDALPEPETSGEDGGEEADTADDGDDTPEDKPKRGRRKTSGDDE